jgi:hypothetical protein
MEKINFMEIYIKNLYIYNIYLIQKKKNSYNYQIILGEYFITFIYSDIINFILIKNFNNNCYFIIFKYNKIKFIIVYFIKTKNKIINYFIYFKQYYKYIDLG